MSAFPNSAKACSVRPVEQARAPLLGAASRARPQVNRHMLYLILPDPLVLGGFQELLTSVAHPM